MVEDKKVESKTEEKKSQRQLEIERLRATRVPPGIPSKNLNYPAREGYTRRIVCDRHGRLDKFLRGGWSYVTKDQLEEQNPALLKAGTREEIDNRVGQVVGSHKDNSAMMGYLMEIPDELYEEDQQLKMAKLDDLESGFRQGIDADQGSAPGKDGRYIPKHTPIKIDNRSRRK